MSTQKENTCGSCALFISQPEEEQYGGYLGMRGTCANAEYFIAQCPNIPASKQILVFSNWRPDQTKLHNHLFEVHETHKRNETTCYRI